MTILEKINLQETRLIMFDLDGTLVDSVPDLAFAVDKMLITLGRAPAGQESVRHWVGNGAAMLVKRALSKGMIPENIDEADFQQASDLFFHYYEQVNGSKSQLYPQVVETLLQLRDAYPFLALITNKPTQFTLPLLAHHQLPKFDIVVCGDTLPTRKPEPAQLLYCLDKLGCRAEESVMVGDSVSDIKAAQAAKVPVVCVNYGYHQGEDLSAYQPDFLIERFEDLLEICDKDNGE